MSWSRYDILSVVAANPSLPEPLTQHRLAELIVRAADSDLLEVEPLSLGAGAPATAALDLERGPRPGGAAARGEQ